jgi:hypothetical protein
MSVNPNAILLPLVEKLEAGIALTAAEIDAFCEASRTCVQENICLRYINEQLKKKAL